MEFFSFGERLGIYRRRKGLSIKNLAELVGVSAAKISSYESDKSCPKNFDEIEDLALVLDVSVQMLLDGFEDWKRSQYTKGILG